MKRLKHTIQFVRLSNSESYYGSTEEITESTEQIQIIKIINCKISKEKEKKEFYKIN